MRKRVDSTQMTPEEKELLRQLMETPGIESKWDFFQNMNRNTPPPEYFMRNEPEPRFKNLKKVGQVAAIVVITLVIERLLFFLL